MRKRRTLCLLLSFLLFLLLPLPVSALDKEAGDILTTLPEILPEEVWALFPPSLMTEIEKGADADLTVLASALSSDGWTTLFSNSLAPALSQFVRLLLSLLSLCILSSLFRTLTSDGGMSEVMSFLSSVVFSLSLIELCGDAFVILREALTSVSVLMRALLPSIGAVYLLSGNVTGAMVEEGGMLLILELMETLSGEVLAPLLTFSFCLSVSGHLSGQGRLEGLCPSVTRAVSVILTFFVTVLTMLLSAQHSIAVQTDGLLMHSIKFAASGVIPVIGGAMGDMIGGAMGAASFLRGSIGTLGTVSILVLMVVPAIQLFAFRMALRIGGMIAASLGCEREGTLMNETVSVFDLMLAVLLVCLFALLFALTLAVRAVSAYAV